MFCWLAVFLVREGIQLLLHYDVLFQALAAAAFAFTAAGTSLVLRLAATARIAWSDVLEATVTSRFEANARCHGLEKWAHDGQAGADNANVAFDEEPDTGVDDSPYYQL